MALGNTVAMKANGDAPSLPTAALNRTALPSELGRVLPVSLVSACSTRLPDGLYACDPSDPESCPRGYYCQLRADTEVYCCYSCETEGVCLDGVVTA
jgi:hypothetical protein